jgi:uncharacterized protein YuzE
MKISYDKEVDAVYIKLIEGEEQCRTLRLNDDIALNIGKGEKLIGIEILDASLVLANGGVPDILLENIQLQTA